MQPYTLLRSWRRSLRSAGTNRQIMQCKHCRKNGVGEYGLFTEGGQNRSVVSS